MSTIINTLTTTRTNSGLKRTDKKAFDKAAYQAYETLKADRDALKETETVYKKRIEDLEKEGKDLLNSYEEMYSENKDLQSKVDLGSDDAKESQLQAEVARLESKTSNLKTENTMFQADILSLQKQVNTLTEERQKADKIFAAEKQLLFDTAAALQKENNEFKYKINMQDTEATKYMQQIEHTNKRHDEVNDKYKEIKRHNIKSESSNKQQKRIMEQEIIEVRTIKIVQQKEIKQLKTTITKLEKDVAELKSNSGTTEQQMKKQNIELDIYKKQASQLKSDVKEKRSRYHELEDELKSLEVKLDDVRYEGFEAVLHERTSLLRKEKSLVRRTDVLEHQVEEHLNTKTELEKQNEEYRLELETAILEKQNSVFAEAAMKRKLEAIENKYGLGRAIRRPVRASGTRVLVTMDGDHAERMQMENHELLNKLKYMEADRRKLEQYARELEKQLDNSLNQSQYSVRKHKFVGQKPIIVELAMPNKNEDVHYPNRTRFRSMHSLPKGK